MQPKVEQSEGWMKRRIAELEMVNLAQARIINEQRLQFLKLEKQFEIPKDTHTVKSVFHKNKENEKTA